MNASMESSSISPGEGDEGELARLAEQILVGLADVQQAQKHYDSAMWDIGEPAHANLRHIQLHLSVTVGKLAKLIEPRDHDHYHDRSIDPPKSEELSPILADLVMHAAQIANIYDLDLGEVFANRYRQNAARFAPTSSLRDFGTSKRGG